jgi:hypothetical protein
MHSLITTVYEKDKNAIYRVDRNDKIFYANLYNSNAGGIFPERIVFWFDDYHKCCSTPKNSFFLVVQFQRAMKQLNWY